MKFAWPILAVCLVRCGGGDDEAPRASTDVGVLKDVGASSDAGALPDAGAEEGCELVEGAAQGRAGGVAIQTEKLVDGLEVPWAMAFLPNGDLLLTERPGRVRLVKAGHLEPDPVATFEVGQNAEDGLLGLALDPGFATNRRFFVYLTGLGANGKNVNRVERWTLSPDGESASFDRMILDGVSAASVHNGGRLRVGLDRMLYVGIGDATDEARAQDIEAVNGKILRLTLDGATPADNPRAGKPWYVMGVRNPHGFDWVGQNLWIADHGPTGELGMGQGFDELTMARGGDNLGWPVVISCDEKRGMRSPRLVWEVSLPPGDMIRYNGNAIPEWNGALVISTLKSRHLQVVRLDPSSPNGVASHDIYLAGDPPAGLGRLRALAVGPDGALYVGTSNCDGRGDCPATGDAIWRVTKRQP